MSQNVHVDPSPRISWFAPNHAILPGSVIVDKYDNSLPSNVQPNSPAENSSATLTAVIEPLKRTISESIASHLPRNERARIMRNVFFISVGFTMLMSSFLATANLQSSIFHQSGIGTTGLAACSFGVIISSICLPQLVIGILTVKWTMCVCMLGHAVYIAAQFLPSYYTLVPAGIIMGLGAGPLWIAQSTYLVHVASVYARQLGHDKSTDITFFFSIFYLLQETSHIWGNLITSNVLSGDPKSGLGLDECGYNHCPTTPSARGSATDIYNITQNELYFLATVNLIATLCASVLIAVNVDSLSRYGESRWPKTTHLTRVQVKNVLKGIFRHIGHRYSLLLMPLSFWTGLQNGFITASFTQAFVSCAFGISHIGHVMMTFGVLSAITAMSLASITEIVGRVIVVSGGVAINLSVMMVMIAKPLQVPITVYAMAAGWGLANAVWKTQLNAIYGSVYENIEMAYSSFKLFEAFGLLVAYTVTPMMCSSIIIPIQAAFIVCALVPYYIFEVMEHKRKRAVQDSEFEATMGNSTQDDGGDNSSSEPNVHKMTTQEVPRYDKHAIEARRSSRNLPTLAHNREALPSTIHEISDETITTIPDTKSAYSNASSASNADQKSAYSNPSTTSNTDRKSAYSNPSTTSNADQKSAYSNPSTTLNADQKSAYSNPSTTSNADRKSAYSNPSTTSNADRKSAYSNPPTTSNADRNQINPSTTSNASRKSAYSNPSTTSNADRKSAYSNPSTTSNADRKSAYSNPSTTSNADRKSAYSNPPTTSNADRNKINPSTTSNASRKSAYSNPTTTSNADRKSAYSNPSTTSNADRKSAYSNPSTTSNADRKSAYSNPTTRSNAGRKSAYSNPSTTSNADGKSAYSNTSTISNADRNQINTSTTSNADRNQINPSTTSNADRRSAYRNPTTSNAGR